MMNCPFEGQESNVRWYFKNCPTRKAHREKPLFPNTLRILRDLWDCGTFPNTYYACARKNNAFWG